MPPIPGFLLLSLGSMPIAARRSVKILFTLAFKDVRRPCAVESFSLSRAKRICSVPARSAPFLLASFTALSSTLLVFGVKDSSSITSTSLSLSLMNNLAISISLLAVTPLAFRTLCAVPEVSARAIKICSVPTKPTPSLAATDFESLIACLALVVYLSLFMLSFLFLLLYIFLSPAPFFIKHSLPMNLEKHSI